MIFNVTEEMPARWDQSFLAGIAAGIGRFPAGRTPGRPSGAGLWLPFADVAGAATAVAGSSSAASARGGLTRPFAIDTRMKLATPMNATDPRTNVPTWMSVRRRRLPSLKPILGSATSPLSVT
jgi:hypothetical protein